MPIDLHVDDKRIEFLSEGAINALRKRTDEYIDDIIKEARNIEEGNRENGAMCEITSNYINNSARKYRNYLEKKVSPLLFLYRALSVITFSIATALFNYKDDKGVTNQIPFAIAFAIACIVTFVQYNKEK